MKQLPNSRAKKPSPAAADTRQKIIYATLAIAAEKGFDQATTAEIAKKAGVAEGSIYNYFRTKDDLLLYTVSEYAGAFLSSLADTLQQETHPLRKLDRLISFHIRFFTQEGNIFQIIYGKRPSAKVQMARILHVAVVPYASLIERIIEDGIEDGCIREMNAQIAASFLLGGMQLTLLRKYFDLADYSPEQTIEEIKSIYLAGILSSPPAKKKKSGK